MSAIMHLLADDYVPFIYPLPIWDYWPWLMLPLCFGAATRFAGFLLDAPKRYVATVRFGVTTTTLDAEGGVVASREVAFGQDELDAALARFTGPQMQMPRTQAASGSAFSVAATP